MRGRRRVWPVVVGALVFAVVSGAGAVVKALGVDNVWWVAGVTAVVTAVGSVMAPRFKSRWDKSMSHFASFLKQVRAAARVRKAQKWLA